MTVRLLYALAIAAALFVACVPRGTAEVRVRSALDLLADVVDPSYSFAVDSCIAQEGDAVRRAEAGSDQAGDEYRAIKARCAVVKDTFEQIRLAHDRAREHVEAGAIDRAESELARIRSYWTALRAGQTGGKTP
jgi:hypothetical protein